MGKDAALQVFAKGLLHVDWRRVVVTLAIKLARACQLQPGLKVLGNRAVQQSLLGVTWVVKFVLATKARARIWMRVLLRKWRDGGHEAIPVCIGC